MATAVTQSAEPVRIGSVSIQGRTALAPLAGFSNRPFRGLCREQGAGLATTEMVSARGLVEGSERTRRFLDFDGDEHPVAVQIYGSEPEVMAEGTAAAAELGADIVDLNCGCPVRKIVTRNAGSALLRDPGRLARILSAMSARTAIPVTVKIRSGWDDGSNAAEIARLAEDSGAAAIAVHGRSRSEGFSGEADWSVIREVRQAVSIPVIGNGDVRQPEDAQRMIDRTGCDMVMIGRWAIGNPWLFGRAEAYLAGGSVPPEPSTGERIATAKRHLRLSVAAKGPGNGVREMRRHLAAYVRGLPGAREFCQDLMTRDDPDGVEEILDRFLGKPRAILTEESAQ